MKISKTIQLLLSTIALLAISFVFLTNIVWGMLFIIIAVASLSISEMMGCFIREEMPIQPLPNTKHICKFCQKEFMDEKKLRRHIGMAHFDKIDI